MRLGACCGLDQARAALDAGFDYVELPASGLLANEEAYGLLKPYATNLFFAGGMRLCGEEKTPHREYAEHVISGAADVDVRVMVVGSGAARRSGTGVTREEAESAFLRVCEELSEIAEGHGIAIAPESLNRSETDVGNDLAALATELQLLGVGFTADSYHVISEWVFDGNEGPVTLDHWREQIPHLPVHVHIGDRPRLSPQPNDPELMGFVKRLSELGYDGAVSLECKLRDNWTSALADLKNLLN